MTDDTFTLTTFYTSWKTYQDRLQAALSALTAEQLALRAAPSMRTIGENAMHIVGCRVFWFVEVMGEECTEEMNEYVSWNEAALAPGAPIHSAAELEKALDFTWQFMATCLARWSPTNMQQTFSIGEDGAPVEISRAWVVWHVLEHDLHHGGEISLTLGMHGIPAEFAL